MTSEILDRFAALDTAAVSDALDGMGLPSGVGDLRAVTVPTPVIGFARTATLEPRHENAPGAHVLTEVVAGAGPRDVIVIDNGGRTDVSGWGGILGLGASRRGVRGVIVDGAVRDVEENRRLGLPVYARSSTPATARGRLQQRSAGEPVRIAGRTVAEGDLVFADDTGLVVVPRDRIAEVLAAAEAVSARETAIAGEVRAGRPLPESMRDARLAGREGTDPPAATLQEIPAMDETPGTASVSDALDRLGLTGALLGVGALRPGQRAAGPAFTVSYEPVDADGGTVGDFLDDVPAGAVVVIDNAARPDCTVWGGIMSRAGRARGVAGTVINGACRDTGVAAEVGYPLWSVARFMRTGKDRVRVKAVQHPVTIGGVMINPGDMVIADDDGAVVVPAGRWAEVATIARRIELVEDTIVDAVRQGSTLRQARADHGYHTLQSRPTS